MLFCFAQCTHFNFPKKIIMLGSPSAIEVDVQDRGVEIKHVNKDKSIFLSKEAWQNLSECHLRLEKALKDNEEYMCTLDASKDLKAHTTSFNNKMYLHVRTWWNDKPTKTGVALLEEDWNLLTPYLTRNPETVLGVVVMKRMIEERLAECIRLACTGCVNNYPSQRDHACLMHPNLTADSAMKRVVVPPPKDFILELAKEAHKQESQDAQVILERPHQTYKKILLFHMDVIKCSVVKNYQ